MARQVAVVAHTHWDREWYRSFGQLRHRLVQVLDRLLTRLAADPGTGSFLLDGQLAVVDDHLELRPGAAGLIRQLATAGRLELGPWYVLMDEFLVSGETIVRDLQLGLRTAAAFGGASEVGYLPDMFGHIAQMPQLLRLAGMEHAVVWRGVPAAIDRTGFWWRAPDGSTVRAEYLPVGYGIGAHLPADPEDLVRRMRAEQAELAPWLAPGDPILLMHGGDHLEPAEHLAELLEGATAASGGEFRFAPTTLAAHLAAAPTDALPSWTGELRSGARANLLMGVASNRVDVRAAAAGAEAALERRAEPLAALWLGAGAWPDEELGRAWREVVRNAAHDSVCACSADDVVTSVLARYVEATAVADAVAADALDAAAALLGPGPVVLNPSARARGGVVEVVVPGEAAPPGTQVVAATPAGATTRTGTGADLGRILAELTVDGWLHDGSPTTAEVRWSPGGVVLDLGVDAAAARASASRGAIDGPATPTGPPAHAPHMPSAMAEAWAQAGANRDRPLTVTVRRPASLHLAVRVGEVPGWGWAALDLATPPGTAPVEGGDAGGGPAWLDNGLVRLEASPADGTFALNGLVGCNRLVDDGDEGDTYNWSPPAADVVVDRPLAVDVRLLEGGPVRGRLRVARRYRWPSAVAGGRRVGEEEVEVVDVLELRAGEAAVRVETTFDNRCRDHRLRAWYPLPRRAAGSDAGCAFAVVHRGLDAEGGPHERALPTFPARGFVTAGELTATFPAVTEYEVVDGGWGLALTLLRATGYLSRPAPAYRPNAAGPPLAVEGPQLLGRRRSRYAVAVGVADPWRLADEAWLPLEVVVGRGRADRRGAALAVAGAEVSSLRRQDGRLELRVHNPRPEATVVELHGRRGWLVDLRGRPLEAFDGSFSLRPWGIATARLDP